MGFGMFPISLTLSSMLIHKTRTWDWIALSVQQFINQWINVYDVYVNSIHFSVTIHIPQELQVSTSRYLYILISLESMHTF